MTLTRLVFTVVLAVALNTLARAAEEQTVEELLGRPIIGPDVPLAEVEDYCEARVPVVPQVDSIQQWEPLAASLREQVLEKVVLRGRARQWHDAPAKVEWLETIPGGEGYRIKKLRYEALPGLWIPALLYEPEQLSERVPVVMNVNGHDGKGKAAAYKQIRCINQARRGMLALNVEWLGMGQLRGEGFQHYRMNQLDLCGTSGLAPFYLSMKRGIDVLLSHKFADPERVAVAGLSGGGWQTIIISSLDTRVTLSNPVAGYSSFRTRVRNHSDLGDSEQTPVDLATVADYAHLTAMMAPRATLLTYNVKDNCCFASDHALPPLLDAARPVFKLYGKEHKLRSHVNHDPGTHNFERDNRQALYRMFADHFYPGDDSFDAAEIACETEVKTAEQLHVELPQDNADFQKLALKISRALPAERALPEKPQKGWFDAQRDALSAVVRAGDLGVEAQQVATEERDGTRAVYWRLRVGKAWTVPAVELSRGQPQATAIVIADQGRKSAANLIEPMLAAGTRVVAVDPFYIGESKIKGRDFLFALLVSAVGDRPLGLQAGQLRAVARWLHQDRQLQPVTIVAGGQRMSLSALVAAALEPQAIGGLRLHDSLGSLKEVIENNDSVDKKPELFCFGLLQQFDIHKLVAAVAPREVRLVEPHARARQELAGLKDWYAALGKEFDPLK